mmetsp:Transcript_8640/g.17508  ORF Transcript_8640/g.17508 Transcript_8640/m.17508 type:complete len:235 (-) Transcript_8640:181-885(-)
MVSLPVFLFRDRTDFFDGPRETPPWEKVTPTSCWPVPNLQWGCRSGAPSLEHAPESPGDSMWLVQVTEQVHHRHLQIGRRRRHCRHRTPLPHSPLHLVHSVARSHSHFHSVGGLCVRRGCRCCLGPRQDPSLSLMSVSRHCRRLGGLTWPSHDRRLHGNDGVSFSSCCVHHPVLRKGHRSHLVPLATTDHGVVWGFLRPSHLQCWMHGWEGKGDQVRIARLPPLVQSALFLPVP